MTYKILIDAKAQKELKKLDKKHAIAIYHYLHDKIAKLKNPRSIGSDFKDRG